MAPKDTLISIDNIKQNLAKSIQKKIDEYADFLIEIRKKELKKAIPGKPAKPVDHIEPGVHEIDMGQEKHLEPGVHERYQEQIQAPVENHQVVQPSVNSAGTQVSQALERSEELSKPPVSESQRKAMYAAAAGKSTLGIPKSVGEEFTAEDKGGKLPHKKSELEKTAPKGSPTGLTNEQVKKFKKQFGKKSVFGQASKINKGELEKAFPPGYKDPYQAFTDAIKQGRLSEDPNHERFVGRYMYMGPDQTGRDAFKHQMTRQYLPHDVISQTVIRPTGQETPPPVPQELQQEPALRSVGGQPVPPPPAKAQPKRQRLPRAIPVKESMIVSDQPAKPAIDPNKTVIARPQPKSFSNSTGPSPANVQYVDNKLQRNLGLEGISGGKAAMGVQTPTSPGMRMAEKEPKSDKKATYTKGVAGENYKKIHGGPGGSTWKQVNTIEENVSKSEYPIWTCILCDNVPTECTCLEKAEQEFVDLNKVGSDSRFELDQAGVQLSETTKAETIDFGSGTPTGPETNVKAEVQMTPQEQDSAGTKLEAAEGSKMHRCPGGHTHLPGKPCPGPKVKSGSIVTKTEAIDRKNASTPGKRSIDEEGTHPGKTPKDRLNPGRKDEGKVSSKLIQRDKSDNGQGGSIIPGKAPTKKSGSNIISGAKMGEVRTKKTEPQESAQGGTSSITVKAEVPMAKPPSTVSSTSAMPKAPAAPKAAAMPKANTPAISGGVKPNPVMGNLGKAGITPYRPAPGSIKEGAQQGAPRPQPSIKKLPLEPKPPQSYSDFTPPGKFTKSDLLTKCPICLKSEHIGSCE